MERRLEMPLARYFLSVGGVLLALLFILNAYLSKSIEVARVDTDFPVIRIHSDRKWPERVVFDTNRPAVTPAQIAKAETGVAAPIAVTEASAKARVREAFAQLQPSDARLLHLSEAKKPVPKLLPKRKIAKRRAAPPVMLLAQRPQFGFLGNNTW